MHAVISELSLATPIAPEVWERARTELIPKMQAIAGFQACHVIELGADEIVLVIIADAAETLDRIATEAGNGFMAEHVSRHLAGPPRRQIGRVVLSS